MTDYVITGGLGFIGSNLAAHLMDQGQIVLCIDNLYRHGSYYNLDWLQKHKNAKTLFTHHHVDIAHQAQILNLFKKLKAAPKAILHFAGQVAATTSVEDPVNDFNTNALGTFNILEAQRQYAPQASLIYASTNKVYGHLDNIVAKEQESRYILPGFPRGIPESMPLDFHSPYGCSKGTGDQYVRDYSRIYGLNTVVLRLSTIYGPRQYPTFDQGWIGWFMDQFLLKKDFTVCGNGKQVRDILYISDFIQLIEKLIEKKDKVGGQIFNVGGGIDNSLSLLEYFKHLEEETKFFPTITRLEKRKGDQDFYVSDITKIKEYTGWYPKIDIKSGLAPLINWYEK